MAGVISGLPANLILTSLATRGLAPWYSTGLTTKDTQYGRVALALGFDEGIRGLGRDGTTSFHLLRVADVPAIDNGTVNFAVLGDPRFSWLSVACALDLIGNDLIDVRYIGNQFGLYDTRLVQRWPDATLWIGLATSPGGTPSTVPIDRFVIGNNALLVPATFANVSTLGLSEAEVRSRNFRHLGWTAASVVTQSRNVGAWGTDGGTAVTADQTTSPDGTLTADLLAETAVSGTHNRYHIPAGARSAAGVSTWGCEIYLKQTSPAASAVNKVMVQLQDGSGTKWAKSIFDLRGAGSFGTVSATGFTSPTAEIEPVNNLWKRARLVATTDAVSTGIGILISLANDAGAVSYLGTAGRGVYVADSSLRPASEIWMRDGFLYAGQFLVAGLPPGASTGATAWAIDGRNAGEGAGAGTGCPVWKRASGWKMADGTAVAA